MRTRAAVAVEKGKPLQILDVDLEGPRDGEVLVEIKATGICHTDEFTLSGATTRRVCFQPSSAMRVRASLSTSARASRALKKGDHIIPLYTPECRQCPSCLSRKTNLCTSIRSHAGSRCDARRHVALLDQWQEDPPLHGLLDLRELYGSAGDRAREGPRPTLRSTRSVTSVAASPPASARCSTPPMSRPALEVRSCSASAASD